MPDERLAQFFTAAEWRQKAQQANLFQKTAFYSMFNMIFLIFVGGELSNVMVKHLQLDLPGIVFVLPFFGLSIAWFVRCQNIAETQLIRLFTDPQKRYEIHSYRGNKHNPARIGFKLSASAVVQMANLNNTHQAPVAMSMGMGMGQPGMQQPGMMQPMYDPQTGQPLQPIGFQQPMMQPMFDPQTGQMNTGMNMNMGMNTGMNTGMAQVNPTTPTQTAVAVPTVETVTVRVPIYGGGGSVNVEYNGNLINVEVPADAKAGENITIEVPDMYKKSKGSGLVY